MARPSSTSSSDVERLARAVKWTIAIVVAIELALSFVPENTMIRTMRWMRHVLATQPAADVQIHGDSVAQGAFFATEIREELPPGTKVWNAAIQGSGPEFTYFLLKDQIAHGHVPKAIVISPSPHTLVTERTAVMVGGFLGWSEIPEAMVASHHFFDALQGVLCKLSFTLRHRDELADLAKGRKMAQPWNGPIPTEEWRRVSGRAFEASHPPGAPGGAPPLIHPVYRQRFVVDPGEREFLARTIALAKAHHVRVFWFALPEHEAIAAVREPLHFAPAVYAFVDSLAARGDVEVLRREFEILPASDFNDYTHLRLPAGLKLSHELGKDLAAKLAVPAPVPPRP